MNAHVEAAALTEQEREVIREWARSDDVYAENWDQSLFDVVESILAARLADSRPAVTEALRDQLAALGEVAEERGESLSLLREAIDALAEEQDAAEREGWAIMDDSDIGREFQPSRFLARLNAIVADDLPYRLSPTGDDSDD